jgi:hypothetical protein
MTIPYRTRLQKLEKANLLRNNSFETGRTFTIDSMKTSFVMDGWQQVGKNVEWVDVRDTANYNIHEAFSGVRAVKITRKSAYETDEQGEGIMSEYVKVIPGNYKLTMFLKLDSVFPLRARIGTKMYDAVDISILYYDRNKIPLTSKYRFPHIDQYINISNKSLSFANYKVIQSFGWGKITGKSNGFPFPEGDIPSEAHYIRVFIGLKGTGTMWVDSVSFAYTHKNFSVSEEMNIYTDTTFVLFHSIIPTPKKYRKLESLIYFSDSMTQEQFPIILVPPDADKLTMMAAQLIQTALIRHTDNPASLKNSDAPIRILNHCSIRQIRESRLIISIGINNVNGLYQNKRPLVKMNPSPDAYFIMPDKNQPNVITLGAHNSMGLYYAALTAVQLIDRERPIFHSAFINDYPDFSQRFYSIGNINDQPALNKQTAYADALVKYKINGAFYHQDSVKNDYLFSTFSSGLNETFQGSGLFKIAGLPSYLTPKEDDVPVYKFPLSESNVKLLKAEIQNSSYRNITGINNLSMPPLFNTQLADYAEYADITYPFDKRMTYFYSGSSFFSLNTDAADIERYINLTGSKPVFMDNSMEIASEWAHYGGNDPFYPGKIRLYNVFEPYTNEEMRLMITWLDTTMFFVNHSVNSEVDIIRLATAADFMWNANAYNKDLALWKVLVSRYHAEVAYELIKYADAYSLALEQLVRLKSEGLATRTLKAGQAAVAELNKITENLTRHLGNQHLLMKDIRQMNLTLQNTLIELENKSASGKLKIGIKY